MATQLKTKRQSRISPDTRRSALPDLAAEWLESDGLGGFASGTVGGTRTRRYHGLLLTATTPPTGRVILVNGFDAWAIVGDSEFALSTQHYGPDVLHPDGTTRIAGFEWEPWPTWLFRLEDGTEIEQEIIAAHGSPRVSVFWKLRSRKPGVRLRVRPLLSGRDYHSLHHENPAFDFAAQVEGDRVTWRPYGESVPAIVSCTNGSYAHDPTWYRNFVYAEERERGLDFTEDLASPGTLEWELSEQQAVWLLEAATGGRERRESVAAPRGTASSGRSIPLERPASDEGRRLRESERRRRTRFASSLQRSADAYLVQRGSGRTIIAGYPWFTDWGRDTFIALRGICLAGGRLDEARQILMEWAGAVSAGMLPNRFPDGGEMPEFNSVDAALWYVVAVHDFLAAAGAGIRPEDRGTLESAIQAILSGFAAGTRHGIRVDEDGLLAAGEAGVQLTWMDAKVGDWVVTPRIGKPVEVEALWLNALRIGGEVDARWLELFERGRSAFNDRFWNGEAGYLYDVVDVNHQPGTVDPSFRPNQILAVGGLPHSLLDPERGRRVVDEVEARLLTPFGLRSLAPGEASYAPRYQGGVWERDGAYHQGTVWPWLLGPFVEAWVRVRGGGEEVKREARVRFLDPLLSHLGEAGLGHISEIADGEPPYRPRGCPFQAWSVGEALRLDRVVLAGERAAGAEVV